MYSRLVTVLTLLALLILSPHRTFAAAPDQLWDLWVVGAPGAWQMGADGHGIRVLVVDSGVDPTGAAGILAGHLAPGYAVNPLHGNGLVANPSPLVDTDGHGTMIVSIVVAPAVGIAPRATVAMAKVLAPRGGSCDDVATAIRWGVQQHFPIINISMAFGGDPSSIRDAVQYALGRGTLVVAATGNEAQVNPLWPAATPGVIAVGASDQAGKRAGFSNGGASILAPGVSVAGVNAMGVGTMTGTSASAALVSGMLADLLSVGLTAMQAQAALLAGSWHGVMSLSGALTVAHQQQWL